MRRSKHGPTAVDDRHEIIKPIGKIHVRILQKARNFKKNNKIKPLSIIERLNLLLLLVFSEFLPIVSLVKIFYLLVLKFYLIRYFPA